MRFKELFKFSEQSFFDSARVLKRAINRKKKRILLICSAIAASLLAASLALFIILRPFDVVEEAPVIEGAMNIIESVECSDGSMDAFPINGYLKIKTNEDVGAGEMKARLNLSGNLEFKVRRASAFNYQVKMEGLEENTLYNLKAVFNGKIVDSWAFQTVKPFCVVSSSPGSNGNDVGSAIEIAFSHADVGGFEEAFIIEPEVKGSFEHYGNTWAFVPERPLDEGALYTVTLKKSINGPNGAALSEDYSFSFSTQYGESFAYIINGEDGSADSFLINEAPTAAISWSKVDISKAEVKVYAFENASAYMDAYNKYVRCGIVASGITSLAKEVYYQFETKPAPAENFGPFEQAAFIQYPEAMPKGYYFSEIKVGGKTLYHLFQSTDLSLYALNAQDDYIIWVNDAIKGMPAAEMKVELEGFKTTKTTASGVAIIRSFDEPKEGRWLKVGEESAAYVAMLESAPLEQEDMQKDYLSYLSADSPYYRSGERVGVFGAILPRTLNGKLPPRAILKSDLFEEDLSLSIDENGAFYAEFEMSKGIQNPNVSLWVDDYCIQTLELSLMEEPPAYELSVSTEKKVYTFGDTVEFSGFVADKNGAPAANVWVTDGGSLKLKTDENGSFRGRFTLSFDENAAFESVRLAALQLHIDDHYEATTISKYLVLPAEYILESEYKNGMLSIGAFALNYDAAESWDSDTLKYSNIDEDALKGAPSDIALYAELHELAYAQIDEGETYDPAGRKVQPKWAYIEKDLIIGSYELNTLNGIVNLQLPEMNTTGRRYYVNLYLDQDRNQPVGQIYLNQRRYYNEYTSGKTYEMVASKNASALGEDISFQICRESDHQTIQEGGVLYAVVADGIIDAAYSNSARFSLKFKEEYMPDAWVYGAYFDGKHCYSLGREYLSYQKEESALKIEMEAPAANILPGQEVQLNFKVSDSSGEPIAATLNLALMDRKLYKINDFEEPLDALYLSRAKSYLAYDFSSYRDFSQVEEFGEGAYFPDDEVLLSSDYKANPIFKTIATDQNGEGSITFTLPEEQVEWKIIAKAISKGGMAATDAFAIVSEKALNIRAVLQESFDIGEKSAISVMAEGKSLAATEACTFKFGLCDQDGKEIMAAERQGIPGHYVHLDFGILPKGNYTVYIQSIAGALEDNAIAFFEVKDQENPSLVQVVEEGKEELIFAVAPASGGSVVTIADHGMDVAAKALLWLGELEGEQLNLLLGKKKLEAYYRSGDWHGASIGIPKEYQSDGLKRLPQNAAAELKLSAIVSAVMPQSVDRPHMVLYLTEYLNNRYASMADRLLSYMGLGALGEPILHDLQYLYKQSADLSEEEAILMALAFAYSGDHMTARFIYNQQISNALVGEGGLYLEKDGEINRSLTELALLLASKISSEDSVRLLEFCLNSSSGEGCLSFAVIAWLDHYVGTDDSEVLVTVSMNGKVESYRFCRYERIGLPLEGDGEIRIMSENATLSAVCGYYAAARN